jgi:hypothetical protein
MVDKGEDMTTTRRGPGVAYWLSVFVGVPVAGGVAAWAASDAGVVSTAAWLAVAAIAACAAASALAGLPRLARMAPRARAAWALGGAVLGTALTAAYAFALLLVWLMVACPDSGCFS